MNFLGHLYLSGNDVSLMQANLYGDFVKGSHLELLPEYISNGVHLHRAIDHYIDNHPAVKELLPVLRPDLPKVAGVAVDLFFDHLLARDWNKHHPQPLPDFLDKVYRSLNLNDNNYSTEYLHFLDQLIHYNWIGHYHLADGLDKLSRGVASRLSFESTLSNGKALFLKHQGSIEAAFEAYIADARYHFLADSVKILL